MHCWFRFSSTLQPSWAPYLMHLYCVKRNGCSGKVRRLRGKHKSKSRIRDSFASFCARGELSINWASILMPSLTPRSVTSTISWMHRNKTKTKPPSYPRVKQQSFYIYILPCLSMCLTHSRLSHTTALTTWVFFFFIRFLFTKEQPVPAKTPFYGAKYHVLYCIFIIWHSKPLSSLYFLCSIYLIPILCCAYTAV